MGNIKDIYDVGKDAASSVKKAKKITKDFKKLIENMKIDMELDETEYFWKKFKDLEELSPKVDWDKLGTEYLEEYKKIKLYYKKNWGGVGIDVW